MNSTTLVPFSSYRNGGTRPSELESEVSNLFRDIDQLFNTSISRFFSSTPDRQNWNQLSLFMPRVDTSETEEFIQVTTELPGMEEKDIDVSLSNGVLTLSGEKKTHNEEKTLRHYRTERSYGTFQRSISMPEEVEVDKVEASFKNGVLTVTLPKTTMAKKNMKKISIKAS